MNLNPTSAAALIAGVVSLIGLAITIVTTIVTARWQVRSKIDELTQAQFKDVILKRIEVYPRLWSIPQTLLSDWERLRKPVDATWAQELFTSLTEWHAENGVFLSYQSYKAFDALRNEAQKVVRKCHQGQHPTLKDLQAMDLIYYAGYKKSDGSWHIGLGYCLKNDLGSCKDPALAAR